MPVEFMTNNGSLNFVVRSHSYTDTLGDHVEWMVYAEVPPAGGDGALVALYDSEQAAKIFAAVMNSAVKMHQSART